MIAQKTIEEIKETVDIVELVESYGVTLKNSGSTYMGLCPFHNERSPSFSVNRNHGTFYCFGCGEKGDAIQFVKAIDSHTFTGAVEALGDMYGIEVVDTAGGDPQYESKKQYIKCVADASWFYRSQFTRLPEAHPAKQDLIRRNYLTVEGREEWLADFGIGYAPSGYQNVSNFLLKKGYSAEDIVSAGLAYANDDTGRLTDRFRNRLLFEIHDIKGRVIGFSGRRMDENDNPKYLNTPETIMYKKSNILFGLDLARKRMSETRTCFVTEGGADAMAVAATGYTNAVASCGTAFGSSHATLVRNIIDEFNSSTKGKFIFVFDDDNAGIKAAMKMFTSITPSIKDRSYVASLDGLDPVDFRVKFGDEELRKRLDNPLTLTEFMLSRMALKYDMSIVEQRSAFSAEAMNLISYIEEPAIFEEYKRKISMMTGINMSYLRGGHATTYSPSQQKVNTYDEIPEDTYENFDTETGEIIEQEIKQSPKPIDSVARTLVACIIQFPNQSFFPLMDKAGITNYFNNPKLVIMLREAMQLIGHTALAGEPTILKPSNFTDEDLFIELSYLNLGTEANRATKYVDFLIKKIESLKEKEDANEVRAKMLFKQVSPEDALQAIIRQRKKS